MVETHSHTELCGHAAGLPLDYAEVAWRRGLAALTVTCHNPLPWEVSPYVRMRPEQLPEYFDHVAEARRVFAGRIDVRLGLECDFVPGLEPFLEAQLSGADFDYALGSVHPQLPEFQSRHDLADPIAFATAYFQSEAEAAETGLFDAISHPDLVKNLYPTLPILTDLFDEMLRCLDRIAETGVAMELNTSGRLKPVPEMNPTPLMLEAMAEREIPLIIGADAHDPGRVGEGFAEALDLAELAGYRTVCHFKARRRIDQPIIEARESLLAGVAG